ncbi:hypothetical protein EYF80_003625 [Liparis tanakae]|uniref:Uncharacterized protein n=1 Tax=Liparis tanakae TaxID=230148 RepID=A0A4Z2J943_9TELE|nr:hypothetical protein EYF80_003625 [Liparis tanakae]
MTEGRLWKSWSMPTQPRDTPEYSMDIHSNRHGLGKAENEEEWGRSGNERSTRERMERRLKAREKAEIRQGKGSSESSREPRGGSRIIEQTESLDPCKRQKEQVQQGEVGASRGTPQGQAQQAHHGDQAKHTEHRPQAIDVSFPCKAPCGQGRVPVRVQRHEQDGAQSQIGAMGLAGREVVWVAGSPGRNFRNVPLAIARLEEGLGPGLGSGLGPGLGSGLGPGLADSGEVKSGTDGEPDRRDVNCPPGISL